MAKIDLEKYKAAWQSEQAFEADLLSEQQVHAFMRAASRNILTLFRRSLVFDIAMKSMLLAAFILLIFLLPYSGPWAAVSLLLVLIHVAGIAWQVRTIRKIPQMDSGAQHILEQLRSYIAYYYQHYFPSIFVGALSSSLFFLIGSMYYFYFQYGEIPLPEIDDLLVLGAGLFLSFTISAVAQLMQNNFRVRQLEARVQEIEADAFTEQSLATYRSRRLWNFFLISIALLAGFLLLTYFIYRFMHS